MPVFHHPRRVEVVTGGEPLVPILGAVVLVAIIAGAYALLTWLADALGVLGEVSVPVAALMPGSLGFAALGYGLGRYRVLVYARHAEHAQRPALVAVPVRPGAPELPDAEPPKLPAYQADAPAELRNRPGTVPARRTREHAGQRRTRQPRRHP